MKTRILLVDDEPSITKALKRLLVRAGYDVHTAESGADALDFLQRNQVCLIITDFRMPEMNGAELLSKVKRSWPETVSLVLSGYTDFTSVVELLNQGLAFRFIEKPWDDTVLLEHIEHALQRYRLQKNNQVRDQLLLGSLSALIEVQHDGVITRCNPPALALLPVLTGMEGKHFANALCSSKATELHAFLDEPQQTLFANTTSGHLIMLEHHLSDPLFHLVQLSAVTEINASGFDAAHWPAFATEQHIYQQMDVWLLNQQYCALVCIGVEQFQILNDLLGYHEADMLLQEIAGCLQKCMPLNSKLCYLNADRFLMLIPDCCNDNEVLTALQQLSEQFLILFTGKRAGMNIRIYGVYGIAPLDGLSGKELMNQMRFGMTHHVKTQQHFFSRFDAELVAAYQQNFELSRALLEPSSLNQMSLRFQPKIAMNTCVPDGAEVLVRWYEPKKLGWVSPALFVPIAERDGQILELGRWIFSQTCQQLQQWQLKGFSCGSMAINLSGRQLKDDSHWVQFVMECLHQFQIKPNAIHFELTETYLVQDLARTQIQLSELRALGFKVWIDDFGSGYSSLAYLNKLPVDGVKLDKAIINDLDASIGAQSMVRNIIRMSHDMKLAVVAEGVETHFQSELLKKMGCDYIQGFYYSRPLKASEYLSYLTEHRKGIR